MKANVPAAILLAAFALAGCQAVQEPAPMCNMAAINAQRGLVSVPSRVPGVSSPLTEMPLNSVSITDKAVIDKIYVRTASARRTPTGTVEVVAQIINCTDHPLNIEGRTQFFDRDQVAAEPVSGWKRLHMAPRTSNAYRESSIGTEKAQYYMVEMRETR